MPALRQIPGDWFIFIGKQIPQPCLYIMHMNPLASINILLCIADAKSVLDHFFSCFHRLKRHLMTLGNLLQGGQGTPPYDKGLPLFNGTKGNGYIVLLVNPYDILHDFSPQIDFVLPHG